MSGILFLATFPFLLCSEQPRLCRWAQHAADTLSRKMQGGKSPNVPKTFDGDAWTPSNKQVYWP